MDVVSACEPVLRRHADHDPAIVCRPALGAAGLCGVLEPEPEGGWRERAEAAEARLAEMTRLAESWAALALAEGPVTEKDAHAIRAKLAAIRRGEGGVKP